MLKIKSVNVTPQYVVCILLLVAILVSVVTFAHTQGQENRKDHSSKVVKVASQYEMMLHNLQVEVTIDENGNRAIILYNYGDIVGVTSLSDNCGLNKLINLNEEY